MRSNTFNPRNKSINQLINQSINQTVSQSVSQSVNPSRKKEKIKKEKREKKEKEKKKRVNYENTPMKKKDIWERMKKEICTNIIEARKIVYSTFTLLTGTSPLA